MPLINRIQAFLWFCAFFPVSLLDFVKLWKQWARYLIHFIYYGNKCKRYDIGQLKISYPFNQLSFDIGRLWKWRFLFFYLFFVDIGLPWVEWGLVYPGVYILTNFIKYKKIKLHRSLKPWIYNLLPTKKATPDTTPTPH